MVQTSNLQRPLKDLPLVVIKIGSSSLADSNQGLSSEKIGSIVKMVASLQNSVARTVLVTSGAIAAGFRALKFDKRPKDVVGRQASAAVGQGLLMQAYYDLFKKEGLCCAQLLLTRQDFSNRRSYVNALNTLSFLVDSCAIPIINENDTTAIEELTFGDNDMLSALVAALLEADLLAIITDIDGLYSADPRKNSNATRISQVLEITDQIRKIAGGTGSDVGTGGMKSKIDAADLATQLGVRTFIGRVGESDGLHQIVRGFGAGTYFEVGNEKALGRKKQWLAFHSEIKGQIKIDDGAKDALLLHRKSLLPIGILSVEGHFSEDSVVEVFDSQGELVGKGIAYLSSSDLLKVLGHKSVDLKEILGTERAEVIHRDNWVSLATNNE